MRALLAAVIIALVLAATPALASGKKPDATQGIYVAMLYEKLLDKTPAFEDWVRSSPKYAKTELYDRPQYLKDEVDKMYDTYNLLTVTEPIVLDVNAKITAYSPLGKGFLVQNFNDMTYFNYTYMGQRYALIPNGVASYQWLKCPADLSDSIAREMSENQTVRLTMTLTPQGADPHPIQMDGRTYKLVMAEISKIELWSKDNSYIVWDTQFNSTDSKTKSLLNLHP